MATEQKMNWLAAVDEARPNFEVIANKNQLVSWREESNFATQVLQTNAALAKCPAATITNAIVNIAAIGLSLNPAQKLAYLVPRDGKACLDISYQGLMKLATDTGVVQWAKAVLVREGDDFVWKGFDEKPEHRDTNPFDTGREVIGGYVVAKLTNGDLMCELMSRAELDDVKKTSKAQNGPWKTWPEEMMKKTLIKRAYKSWPKSGSGGAAYERMGEAIEIINQHEGLDKKSDAKEMGEVNQLINAVQLENIRAKIKAAGIANKNPKKLLDAFEIDRLENLPAERYDECMERLDAVIAKKQEKAEKKKTTQANEKKPDGGKHPEAEDAEITSEGKFTCTACGEVPMPEEGMMCDNCIALEEQNR